MGQGESTEEQRSQMGKGGVIQVPTEDTSAGFFESSSVKQEQKPSCKEWGWEFCMKGELGEEGVVGARMGLHSLYFFKF